MSGVAIFSLIGGWLFFGWPKVWQEPAFPPQVQESKAAEGSIYIARAGSTNLITNLDATEQTLTYDTEVNTSADISRQSGNQDFRIENTGRYLIIANTSFNYADIGNNNRHVVRTQIKIGGTALPSVYGMASGYGRDSGSADEDGVLVTAYVDHTYDSETLTNNDITVHVQNFGDTSVSLADQIANQSGIQIVRLPDDSEYLQVSRTSDITFTGTMDQSINDSTWNEFGWETQDVETNSSVLEWASGNDVTLKSSGHYLVIYSIRADTSGSNRKGAVYRLKLDDVEVPASTVLSYMRGSDGSVESWVQWGGIVNASANDVLNIDWASASEVAGGTLSEAAMTVVKLPDTADYLRIRYDSSRAGETTGAYPFNQEDEDDDGVHDNSTNNTRISGNSDNHDWLLFASWELRNVVADSTRTSEHFRWYRTGTEVQYGSGLSYTRGDQSSTGVPAGGRSAVLLANGLGSSEYIELNMRLESGTGNQNRDFVANRVGITGVAIDTLVSGTTISVSVSDGAVSYGALVVNTEEDTTATGVNDTQTATNDGNVTEDFNIRTSIATGGTTWSVGSTAGSDSYVHSFSTNSGSSWEILDVADAYETLSTAVSSSGTQDFDLKIGTPTSVSDYVQKTITVTVQAVQN